MDDSVGWIERLFTLFLNNPEKSALVVVVLAGAWRWIRELIREARGDAQEETLMEILLRENKEQREETRILREELRKDREDDHE